MQVNFMGLVAAMAAFLSIWWGHVAVRKIESTSKYLWLPMLACLVFGISAEVIAALIESVHLSAVFGIVGLVLLWDTFELFRQQKRVKKGHAPANLNNPRHASILAMYPEATTLDWLERDPRGRAYSDVELAAMGRGMK